MKVVKKKGDNGLIHLDVTASTSEVSEALNRASIQFCQQMGIRPAGSKSPAQAASEQMGIKDLDSVVAQQAIEFFPPKAVEKSGIAPAYMPEAEPKTPLKRGRTFHGDGCPCHLTLLRLFCDILPCHKAMHLSS